VRVGRDIRLIVHKTAASLLLRCVGRHNDARGWAKLSLLSYRLFSQL